MGRGKRSGGLRTALQRRLVVWAAEEQVRQAARWSQLSDDEEVRRWAREGRCVICGAERQKGRPLCDEHYGEALENALENIERDIARQERARDRAEDCRECDRKSRYRCGHCQAKGVRPRPGFLWCWSCHGLGEWGSGERTGCQICNATGYLSELDTAARLGQAFPPIVELVARHQRELRCQRIEIWEGEEMVHGLDLSDRIQVLRYSIGLDGTPVADELLDK